MRYAIYGPIVNSNGRAFAGDHVPGGATVSGNREVGNPVRDYEALEDEILAGTITDPGLYLITFSDCSAKFYMVKSVPAHLEVLK